MRFLSVLSGPAARGAAVVEAEAAGFFPALVAAAFGSGFAVDLASAGAVVGGAAVGASADVEAAGADVASVVAETVAEDAGVAPP
jgi:hypothetical protein